MSYAARHPGLFQAAASFSGAVDTRYGEPASGVAFTNLHTTFGTPNDNVWGNQVTNEAEWRRHNPTDRVTDLACVALFIASGDGLPGGPAGDDPSNPGGYLIEQFIFQMNLSFVRALVLAGVPFTSDFYGGGYHGWPYWQRELHWALPQVVPIIAAGGSGGPCGPVTPPPADHFRCARARAAGPAFPRRSVMLADRFGSTTAAVVQPATFCSPVDKNGEGIPDAGAALACYKIASRGASRRRAVAVRNQFGDQTLAVTRARGLCVPSAEVPASPAANLDHFQCYKVTTAPGAPRFQRRTVTLADPSGVTTATVVRPDSLCTPADKNAEGIPDPAAALVCYRIASRTPTRPHAVVVRNQFGDETLGITRPRTLCVPTQEGS